MLRQTLSRVNWDRVSDVIAHCVVAVFLVAPLVVYVETFGSHLSHDLAVWAAMGSAMSGIYGPILAVLAFVVLTQQVRFQAQSNKHMFDHAHLQNAQADLAFYLLRLELALNERMQDVASAGDGASAGAFLESWYSNVPHQQLQEPSLQLIASDFNRSYPKVLATWNAIQSIFAGLTATKEFPYDGHASSAKQKAVVTVTYGVCVALDKFVWCVSEGRLGGPYLFAVIPARSES